MFGLSTSELRILKKLSTPINIQNYLDSLPIIPASRNFDFFPTSLDAVAPGLFFKNSSINLYPIQYPAKRGMFCVFEP